MELYEHNKEALSEVLSKYSDGYKKIAYVASTGTGKSYLSIAIIEELNLQNSRILIVAPRLSLIEQWKFLLKAYPNIDYITYSKLPYLTFTEIKNIASSYSLIIFDEIHHFGANIWGEVINAIFSFMQNQNSIVLGLTADPVRYDLDRDMSDEYFDYTVYGPDVEMAISSNIINDIKYVLVAYKLTENIEIIKNKLKGRKRLRADDYENRLIDRLESEASKYDIKNIILSQLPIKDNIKILVFVNSIQEIYNEMDRFKILFPDANFYSISSNLSRTMNRSILSKFDNASSGMNFLFSVGMLNEGVHLSDIDALILLRRTDSPTLYWQQIGRILSAGNNSCGIVYDFASNYFNITERLKYYDEQNNILGSDMPRKIFRLQVIDEWNSMDILELLQKLKSRECWEEWEDSVILNNQSMRIKQIQKDFLPHRTIDSIKARRRRLKVSNGNMKYTDVEIKIILNHKDLSAEEIQQRYLPQRSTESIRWQRRQLGFVKDVAIWTTEEEQIVRDNKNLSSQEIHDKFLPNRTPAAIQAFKSNMSIRNDRFWTSEEEQIVLDHIDMTGKELHEKYMPNKSASSINQKRRKLLRYYGKES